MTTYIIGYDLKRVKNYPLLYKCLVGWKANRLLESFWIANLVGPSATVRDILRTFIDADDAIAVIELPPGIDWATLHAQPGGVALLKALGHRAAA